MIEDPQLRELFKAESEEHLQRLDDALLRLERSPADAPTLEDAFREAHSLKGAARMLGVSSVHGLAHRLEDSLNAARRGSAGLAPELIPGMARDVAEIRRRVAEAVGARPDAAPSPPQPSTAPPPSPPSAATTAPPPTAAPALASPPAGRATAEAPEAGASATAGAAPFRIESVRVSTGSLDALMTHAGELAVTRTRVARRLSDIDLLLDACESLGRDEAGPALASRLARFAERLERLRAAHADDSTRLEQIAFDIESAVREIRLLPLSNVFKLFPRLVRDQGQEQGKDVELVVEGGSTTADKRILEEMKDPLMHMLRNAVDHGIESPQQRQATGKPPVATVRIRASRAADGVLIEVSDDGRGLDDEAIRETAVRRGLANAETAAAMTPSQLHALIFAPGFSTSQVVTGTSGRGIGLDAVRANVERLKGTITVQSSPGRGTRMRIRLPATLGTMQVLLVIVNGHHYGVPAESVKAVARVSPGDIFTIEGHPTTLHEGQPASVVALAGLLQLRTGAASARRADDAAPCVFLQIDGELFGLFVDALVDEQEVLLKPPSSLLGKVRCVAGATILNSGDICMILDAHQLRDALPRRAESAPPAARVEIEARPKLILLAEDSITTRAQEVRILEAAGYEVVATANGLEALQKLASRRFDAVVSDVNMPHLDGLQLTERIRAVTQYQDLPIILVTSLADTEDKRRGLEAGANAYITKPEFDQRILLDSLRRLVG